MLYFDLNRIFAMRGISKPFKYLIGHGFSHSTANRFVNSRVDNMNLEFVEKLCKLFKCTPNDLISWKPDKDEVITEENPLQKLRRQDDFISLRKMMSTLPLTELEQFMKSLSKENEGGIK